MFSMLFVAVSGESGEAGDGEGDGKDAQRKTLQVVGIIENGQAAADESGGYNGDDQKIELCEYDSADAGDSKFDDSAHFLAFGIDEELILEAEHLHTGELDDQLQEGSADHTPRQTLQSESRCQD